MSGYRYWEKPIDKSYDCIYINSGEVKNIKVQIKGIIQSSLIQENRIRYRLLIEEFEVPLSSHSGKVLDYEHYKTYISDKEIRYNIAISFKGIDDLPEGYIISAVDRESAEEMIYNLFRFNWL